MTSPKKPNRRTALRLLTCRTAALGLVVSTITDAPAQEGQNRGEAQAVEEWMNAWMSRRMPVGTLHLSRFKERVWFLTKPIGWKPTGEPAARFQAVEVPSGFVTDFASIPRIFWSLLPPDGEYTYPAIIHDYLYWMQQKPRLVADDIFRLVMQEFQIPPATAETIYRAVRLAGESAWSENARLKAGGEKRILKRVPDDPRTTWADWKKEPDVFE